MKRVAVYTRVSTDDQATNGLSIETQVQNCNTLIVANKDEAVEIIKDEGYSGGNLNRPGIKLLIRLCTEKKIDVVMMVHSDRLARNTKDHLTMRSLFDECGVKVVYVMQPNLSNDDAYSRTMDTILSSFNELQRLVISDKTKSALDAKAREGWFPGQALPGYMNISNPKFRNPELSRRIVVPNPETAPIIRDMFEMYASGNYNGVELAEYIYERGVRSSTGHKIAPSSVYRYLRNTFYVGELRWGKIYIPQAKHEAIVERSVFDKAQEVLAVSGFASRRRKHFWLLSGLIFCHCGFRFVGEKHPKKNKNYYHCRKVACSKYCEAENLEAVVARKLSGFKFSDDFVSMIVEEAKELLSRRRNEVDKVRHGLTNKKIALEKKQNVLEEKLITGTVDDHAFVRMNNRINDDVLQIDMELLRLTDIKKVTIQQIQVILAFARNIEDAYKKAVPELKRQYLNLFFEGFDIEDGKITNTKVTPLFASLVKANKLFVKSSVLMTSNLGA